MRKDTYLSVPRGEVFLPYLIEWDEFMDLLRLADDRQFDLLTSAYDISDTGAVLNPSLWPEHIQRGAA